MARRSKKTEFGICVYCGKNKKITREHVIPSCLFLEGRRPSEPVIVPVCKDCNDRKAGDDSYMRDVINVDIDCDGHPTAMMMREDKMRRSVLKGRSQLAKELVRRARPVSLRSPAGLHLGSVVGFSINQGRLQRWGQMLVRGLYWARHQARIPDHYEFKTERLVGPRRHMAIQDFIDQGAAGPFRMGAEDEKTEETATWSYVLDKDDILSGMWIMAFNERYFLFVVAGAPGSAAMQRHAELSNPKIWRP